MIVEIAAQVAPSPVMRHARSISFTVGCLRDALQGAAIMVGRSQASDHEATHSPIPSQGRAAPARGIPLPGFDGRVSSARHSCPLFSRISLS